MAVSFRITTSTPGRGSARKSAARAKEASAAVMDEIDYAAGKVAVTALGKAVDRTNEQKIYIAAMFFQWAVSRTPVDEVYDRDGELHEPDEDSVRDDWYISYGRMKLRSKDFPGCFDQFNDKNAIDIIAKRLQQGIKTSRNIRSFRVYNTNPRFSQLEYGEYKYTSSKIYKGPEKEHGVAGGFSIQAPRGMLRITEIELDWITNFSRQKRGLLARGEEIRSQKQVPDKRRTRALIGYLKTKRKVRESDLEWLK